MAECLHDSLQCALFFKCKDGSGHREINLNYGSLFLKVVVDEWKGKWKMEKEGKYGSGSG